MKTTPKHFEIFKAECKRWINFWGLTEWDVHYFHNDENPEDSGALYGSTPAMAASICLSKELQNQEPTEENLSRIAFHEVGELLLTKYEHFAMNRFGTERERDMARHEIINRLENRVFEMVRGKTVEGSNQSVRINFGPLK